MQTSTTSRRTWKATAYVMLDRVIIERRTYTIIVERAGDTLTSATVDGQPATIEHAAHLLVWAKATGTLQIVERFDVALLGKARAARLHRILARLGLSSADHYRTASAALARTVDSLAALTEAEGRRVWNHARAVRFAYQQAAA